MHRAYLLLGSNITPERNLPAAVRLLAGHGTISRTSRVWESPPADGSSQANYLNAAVLLETIHSAEELRVQILPSIEAALGRIRDPLDKYAARTIDIDIALFDQDVCEVAGASIPDPDTLRRAFVAVPLAELDPDYIHPTTGQSLRVIAATFAAHALPHLRDDVQLEAGGLSGGRGYCRAATSDSPSA